MTKKREQELEKLEELEELVNLLNVLQQIQVKSQQGKRILRKTVEPLIEVINELSHVGRFYVNRLGTYSYVIEIVGTSYNVFCFYEQDGGCTVEYAKTRISWFASQAEVTKEEFLQAYNERTDSHFSKVAHLFDDLE